MGDEVKKGADKNPNIKSKEEGELSSSEDDEILTASAALSSAAASDQEEFGQETSLSKSLKTTSAGKIHSRSTQKVRAPFVPFVITFSDDDSDSESEDLKPSKPAEIKGSTVGMKENKRPNPSSVPNAQLLRQTIRHVASAMASRSSLTQTFTSSMPNVNRNTSTDGHLTVDTRSRFKNLSTSNRELVGQEHGCSGNSNLGGNKLQDLRQKIEMREKELKLRSVSENKDNGSGSCRNYNVSDSEVDAPSKRRNSADFTRFEGKEPHIKRVKLSGPHEIRQISDAHLSMPPLEPGITSGKYASDNTDRCIRNGKVLERGSSRIPVPLKSAQKEKQVDTVGILSSGTRITSIGKGVDTSVTGNSPDMDKLVYPSNTLERTKRVVYATAKNLPEKTAILSGERLCKLLNTMGIPQGEDINLETLFDIADMQDKELEQAQEHRHKCEVEERNALRAYRKAQRALIEANARCTHLYQNVELLSSHLQPLVDPTSFQSATLQTRMNSLEYVPDEDLHDLPTSSHQRVDVFDVHNEQDRLLSIKSVDGATQSEEERHAAGQLATDSYSGNDDSGSACLKDKRLANGVRYSSSGLSASTDEDDERFPFDEKPVDSHLGCKEIAKVTNDELKKRSLELEATLRSQLFARLGTKASSKNRGTTQNFEPAFEPSVEHSGHDGQAETNIGNVSSSMKEISQYSPGGNGGVENMSSQTRLQNNDSHVENFSSNCASPAADPGCLSSDGKQLSKYFSVLCPILRSTFSHMRVAKQDNIIGLKNLNPIFDTCDTYNDEGHSVGLVETQSNNQNSTDYSPVEKSPVNIWSEKVGYYTSNIAIDPFQPLCVFELRGKCNNDECPWQHIKDYSCKTINVEKSENLDSRVGFSSCEGKLGIGKHTSRSLDSRVLTPPTYLVSLDMMKTDSYPHGSLLGTSVQKCWQKCLSTSLVLSSRLTSDLPTEEPFLHGSDARDEVHGSRNSQSYFQRNLSLNVLDQQIADNDQVLELALLNLSQGVNERKSKIEALKVLARSLKANPSSVIHWIAYLHIYHSDDYFPAKGDMLSSAVEHNQGSYELWLIYINTRMQPEDRLTAYNDGIVALCRHGSAADGNAPHSSECILDLFLQYLNFSCNSGYISRASEKIYKLCYEKNSESHDPLMSNIIPCFTLRDKCIFWFCCIYLTIYKKLPDTIVHRFECQKELDELEWPSVNLTFDEKHQNELLMGMAVDSLALVLDSEALESESAINASHMFAVNHVKCIAVLEGIECSKKLLDKYMKSYPSCLELVLLSAQMKASESANLEFVGFEDALRNWKEDVPGLQCMWNHYANFSLQNGRFDFAKQLMDRWFHSVWQVQYSESASAVDGVTWSSNASKIDTVFGLINLSLYKFFDDNLVEARLAIDGALKAASAENYKHCVKEHVSFLLSSGDVPSGGLLNILKNYLVDPRAISTVQPLSRKFIDNVKKPRIRSLVSSLWSDLSTDFSLVNLVLEVFYGPSLLPHLSCKLQDVVDMVESLMEIAPANYRLAISVGKLLSRDFKLADTAFAGVSFWATSLITNSLFQAVPIPPELIWIEAADTLHNLTDTRSITESFHKRALTAYPLSIRLWKSYLDFSQVTGNTSSVIAAAKERGIILD